MSSQKRRRPTLVTYRSLTSRSGRVPFVPAPNTHSDDLTSGEAKRLEIYARRRTRPGLRSFTLIKPEEVQFISVDQFHPAATALYTQLHFRRETCAGPAPYVGLPFHYRWDVWISGDNTTWIALDARRHFVIPWLDSYLDGGHIPYY